MKKIIKYTITYILLLIIFNSLLYISSLFPSSWIEQNVKESSEILLNEGNDYMLSEKLNINNNNYTDALMINEAYSIDNSTPIYSYMSARRNYKKGTTQQTLKDIIGEGKTINSEEYDPVGELNQFLNGKMDTSIIYARYWHGYLPILRTLLIFFNISQIRKILLIIFVIIFTYLMYLLRKKLGIKIMLIYGFSLIAQGYFYVSYSLESAPVFITMMIACIILLKKIDKISKEKLYLYIFIISSITSFIDYLTVPLITLVMPLYIYIIYNKELKVKENIKLIIKTSIIWLIGYAITWISKWVIYDIMYNEELIKTAINQVIYRTVKTNICTSTTIQEVILMLIIKNAIYIITYILLEMLVISINIDKIKIEKKDKKEYIKQNAPILILTFMPIIWYIVLSNHTVLHYKFTYRHMLIYLTGTLILITNIINIKKKTQKQETL